MKGIKIGLLTFCSLAVLTGCGNKNLSCTMESSTSGMNTTNNVEINFKNDKVEKMKVVMDIEVHDEYKDQKQTLIDSLKQADKTMEVKETKKGIQVTADENSSYFSKLNLNDNKAKYSDVKKALEDGGFTCK